MSVKRILVVDDSLFMRKIISDLIAEMPNYQVVGTAKNGLEAVELNMRLNPDCITMDVEMPEMNGLEALKQIMRDKPTPVIMLSSVTSEGALETIRALELGALDFIQKPSGSISLDLFKVKDMLHEKLQIAVQSNIRRLIHNKPVTLPKVITPPESVAVSARASGNNSFEHLVVIGTSTGGPKALLEVLSRLPSDFPAPVVIVQHMPPNFTHSLAVRLNANCQIRVVEGADGMLLQTATAYIAPGGCQTRVIRQSNELSFRLQVSREEPRSGHRPSVNTLFESILPFHNLKKYAVIMTGMGSDGAEAMQALKNQGEVVTIAESEDTCVVYGMPRAAVRLGCVDHSLPVQEIGDKLITLLLK